MRATATGWVDDARTPLVRVDFADADGQVHHLRSHPSVIDNAGVSTRDLVFPIEVLLECEPHNQHHRHGEDRLVNVVELTSRHLSGPPRHFAVDRSELSWSAPGRYSDLSIRARQAAALVTFRRWRESFGLFGTDLLALEDHLWEYATVTGETFQTWFQGTRLTNLHSEEPLPTELRGEVAEVGLDSSQVRRAIFSLTQITYGGLFGGVDSFWSLGDLEAINRFAVRHGTSIAAADSFADSLWIDDDWGRPSEDLVRRWRSLR